MRALLLALTLLCACGVPRPADPGDPAAAFPHPEGYADAHGITYDGQCGSCHGLHEGDPVRGAAPVAPACRSCHTIYPHPPSLTDGGAHGAAWLADSQQCSSCHGADGERAAGGRPEGQCTSCHSTFPHTPDWAEGDAHGAAAQQRGPLACAGCHGVDGGDRPASDCASCHDAYPHDAGFASPGEHGERWASDPAACAGCHDSGAVTCASCHDLFPHPDDLASVHPMLVQQRGALSCAGCHPSGVTGPALPTTCGPGCHDGSAP